MERIPTRFLAISDLHGHVDSLRLLHERLDAIGAQFDFVIFAGDFSNFIFDPVATIQDLPFILKEFERFKTPVYFIRGNRDQNMQLRRVLPVSFKNGINIEDRVESAPGGLNIAGHLAKGIETLHVDEMTILVTHDEPAVIPFKPLLHLAGHTHAPRFRDGFVNLGWLYRTPEHGGKAMAGIFWLGEIEPSLEKPVLKSLVWYALEGKDDQSDPAKRTYPFKQFNCPKHPTAGTWIIPFYWKQCTLCYKERAAREG